MMIMPMNQVLFLCSANYYRSRFAEHLFNHLASQVGLDWRAESRGLMVGFWGEVGLISPFTVDALTERGIPMEDNHRQPVQLTEDDLHESHLVVALKEVEHRSMIAAQFPQWEQTVQYWDVDDVDCATPEDAIPYLEARVRSLVTELHGRRSDRQSPG
jgi:protein-tyrosine phosphatase